MIGKTLGHYEVLELLGQGGMGEVYRARDRRLDRDVAIKVLPEAIARNAEVQSRFQREAKTISSLNHPHICVLHDVGQEGDVRFLVMELVDGVTLAQHLRKGPMQIADVLRVGAQIADALDRAHRAGVIHRDLKPGNVMLTKSGAKLMDFGLARVDLETQGGSDVTVAESPASPTVASPLTAEGAIVGTFQYMAPEQLEGQEVDRRSDLWALGCVLYEMSTGRRAFQGKTQASLIGSIMHTQPEPVSQISEVSPPELDRLVQSCLAKDPDDRIQSAHDVKLQLDWIAEGASSTSGRAATGVSPARRRSPLMPMLAVAIVAAVGGALGMRLLGGADPGAAAGAAEVYEVGRWDLASSSAPAFSRDGRVIAFSVQEPTGHRIYRRDVESLEATQVQGTGEGKSPFFSPDGAWMGFVTPTAVKKVPAGGGVAQIVLRRPGVSSGAWSDDGTIYLALLAPDAESDAAVLAVPEGGGPARTIMRFDAEDQESECWLPEVLPGAQTLLVSVRSGGSALWKIVATDMGGARRTVAEDAFLARYSRTGHLLYMDNASLSILAAPFDAEKAVFTGGPLALTETIDDDHCFDVSRNGRVAYVPIAPEGQEQKITWLEPNGSRVVAAEMSAQWIQPRVSPDGKRIAVRKVGTLCELWVLDVARNTLSRLAQEGDAHDPVWSPDGRRILYQRNSTGQLAFATVAGPREDRTVGTDSARWVPWSWQANGLVALTREGTGTLSDIWILDIDGNDEPRPFLTTPSNETAPVFSPDGNWIAYVTNETGSNEVLLRAWPDGGGSWQVSMSGGTHPAWAADGNRLYYKSGSRLMAVSIDTSSGVAIGAPVLVSDALNLANNRNYDIAPDGRLVATLPEAGSSEERIRVLIDWPARYRELAGTAR